MILLGAQVTLHHKLKLHDAFVLNTAMYKWNPEDYRQNSSEMQKWARELLVKPALKGTESLLDIGCGDGKVTAEIAGHLPHGWVVGIDSSPDMIGWARKQFPADRFPNLSFQVMDASDLSFTNEFDTVFSNATLHWVTDHLPVLRGIRKSLKRSGRLLLQMGGRGNIAAVLEVVNRVIACEKWSHCFTDFRFPWGFYGPEEYRHWLEQAGLRAKRVQLIPKVMVHEGRGGFQGWLRTLWLPYIQRVPPELRQEFIDEVADAYLENHPPNQDGLVRVQVVRLEVEAEAK